MKTLKETIAAMLTENTGKNMLDSGGASGRAWQRNAGKALDDFASQAQRRKYMSVNARAN